MIKQAERSEVNGFSLSVSQEEIPGRVENLAMVMQMYRELMNVDVAIGIFRDAEKDKCMVIGRSGVDEINIGVLMRSLGGGRSSRSRFGPGKGCETGCIVRNRHGIAQGQPVFIGNALRYHVVPCGNGKRKHPCGRCGHDAAGNGMFGHACCG